MKSYYLYERQITFVPWEGLAPATYWCRHLLTWITEYGKRPYITCDIIATVPIRSCYLEITLALDWVV